ncbi:MAG: hypothetical protein K0S46_1295 [Moraxellaceae bacterium]|jgi:sugar lactone lactonase YvrE|nr:hypothetical protein [Moraxellaceae bacterium]
MSLLKRATEVAVATLGGAGETARTEANVRGVHLRPVAEFTHQVTGVAVSRRGRVFVNFPRWTEDTEVSVAEVLPGSTLRPFPDDDWNAWRNSRKDEMAPARHFICVQSVVVDARDHLWVLDPAAPAQSHVVRGGAKLVEIDLATDHVVRTLLFDEDVAPLGSYLNDVRISPDGAYAYITDSGAKGALVVVRLADAQAWRVLDGHASTQPEKDVQIKVDRRVLRRPDGRGVEFAADGIALSTDGHWLYWQAIKGRTLYRLPTALLQDRGADAAMLAAAVERVGENGPADGLLISTSGRMYISAVEENAVKVREGDEVSTLLQDRRLRWPDSFAEGPDGTVYVTDSRIPDMVWFRPHGPAQLRTTLYRIEDLR